MHMHMHMYMYKQSHVCGTVNRIGDAESVRFNCAHIQTDAHRHTHIRIRYCTTYTYLKICRRFTHERGTAHSYTHARTHTWY